MHYSIKTITISALMATSAIFSSAAYADAFYDRGYADGEQYNPHRDVITKMCVNLESYVQEEPPLPRPGDHETVYVVHYKAYTGHYTFYDEAADGAVNVFYYGRIVDPIDGYNRWLKGFKAYLEPRGTLVTAPPCEKAIPDPIPFGDAIGAKPAGVALPEELQ